MKVILIIILIWVIKVILTKAISLLEVLISCAIKGKKINYNTNKWNEYGRLKNENNNNLWKYEIC